MMKKTAIVYWSGTGNTEAMAKAIAEGAKSAGAEVDLLGPGEFDAAAASKYESIAFGCPAMGAEELEEMEFAPMWESVKGSLGGKTVILFGSYGWGDGDWMRSWEDSAPNGVDETYICQETPGPAEEEACRALGAKLAG